MNVTLEETARDLRALAATAAPTAKARPDLARLVLDRLLPDRLVVGSAGRRPWARRSLLAATGLVVAAAVAAGVLTGRSPYFTVIQPSSAMEPTVRVEEGVVFDRTLAPARGDVVFVRLEADGRSYESMLRVVGVGGDRVGCPEREPGRCDAIVVNGTAVPEPFLPAGATAPFGAVTVPAGALFLLGDHRSVAIDSRMFGPVAAARVNGVAVEIVGRDGVTRAVPGAPPHRRPGDADNVDPAGPVPPAGETTG